MGYKSCKEKIFFISLKFSHALIKQILDKLTRGFNKIFVIHNFFVLIIRIMLYAKILLALYIYSIYVVKENIVLNHLQPISWQFFFS